MSHGEYQQHPLFTAEKTRSHRAVIRSPLLEKVASIPEHTLLEQGLKPEEFPRSH